MTKDNAIRIAKEAGFWQEEDDIFICGIEHIAKLLMAEREACAKVCDRWEINNYDINLLSIAIRARGQE